ncbi:MAG: hypothetical protein KJO07_00535 [Deltaproteobacteria bacterium]|nr:hypothetical protein [Deltaproteobacteria bacterium]
MRPETCAAAAKNLRLLITGSSDPEPGVVDGVDEALGKCRGLSERTATCVAKAADRRQLIDCRGITKVLAAMKDAKKSNTKEARDEVRKIYDGAKAYYR